MQAEKLMARRGGLFSGLEAKAKLNQLLDEFYGNLLQEEKAPKGKTVALAPEVTQHFFVVPPGLERATKKKQTV